MKIVYYIFILFFLFLLGKGFWIQIFQQAKFRQLATLYHTRKRVLQSIRGNIYDRNGKVLATNGESYSIFANPRKVRNLQKTAERLAEIFKLNRDRLCRKLNLEGYFTWIKREVSEETARKIKHLKLPGIYLVSEEKREYPHGKLAANLLGMVGVDQQALGGLEKQWDGELSGKSQVVNGAVDAHGDLIFELLTGVSVPTRGNSLVLTLDETIQGFAEETLDRVVKKHQAKAGTIIVMNPKTFEVLAMANRPTFDPNEFLSYPSESWRNRAVTDLYEPGSTFKIVVASAGLQEKIIDLQTPFYCGGSYPVANHTIHCAIHSGRGGHGSETIRGIIRNSCNVGAGQLGLRVGPEILYKYLKAYGFCQPTKIGFPGEAKGQVGLPQFWTNIKTANVSFGQGVSVTSLQLLCAYCTIANDGVLMKPQLVREIINERGEVIKKFSPQPVRQVISAQVASQLKEMLQDVVQNGTGKAAQIKGYRVAGKTGTAQKPGPKGLYEKGKYISTFVGFAPADDPKVAVLVMVDEPKGTYWGATVAAPAFKEVTQNTLWHLGIPPSGEKSKKM